MCYVLRNSRKNSSVDKVVDMNRRDVKDELQQQKRKETDSENVKWNVKKNGFRIELETHNQNV